MTKEELIEFACEITDGSVRGLSSDQMQKLMMTIQRLAEFSLDETRLFGNLCAVRSAIDAAITATTDDLVALRLTQEQCTFLLALIDQEIREHA